MDFLKIRKKARERAQREASSPAPAARAAVEAPSPPPSAGDAGASAHRPGPPPPPDAPVLTEDDLLAGALAARLQGLPAAEAGPTPDASRFRTWRPGAGAPPPVDPDPAPPGPVHDARPEDFAIVAPGARGADPVASRPERRVRAARPAPPADPLDDFFYREDEPGPALGELEAPDAAPEPQAQVLAREELLTFLLGAEEFAVAIEHVREVVRAPPITEVPRAPSHVLGVVTVRGEVVAVLDPRRRLGLAPGEARGEGKIVIVDAGEGPCGLQVDRIASVVRLLPGTIEPCPQGIAGPRGEFIVGIGRDGERLFTVLDVAALLRRAPQRAEGRADAGA